MSLRGKQADLDRLLSSLRAAVIQAEGVREWAPAWVDQQDLDHLRWLRDEYENHRLNLQARIEANHG